MIKMITFRSPLLAILPVFFFFSGCTTTAEITTKKDAKESLTSELAVETPLAKTFLVGSTEINTAVQPDEIIVYKTAGTSELELHVFEAKNVKNIQAKTPAIVFFHGGGWVGGNPSLMYDQADYFSKQGVKVISVQYRLQKTHATPPLVSLMDAKSAFRWVRKNAERLNIEPDNIAAGGGSAGGHLAAALASIDGFNDHRDDVSISTLPSALILFNPVMDNGPTGYGYKRVKPYWSAFSPLHNIKEGHPPTIIFFGTKDKFVPVETAYAYQKAIQDHGGRADLHMYEGKKHAFFNRNKSSESFRDTVIKSHQFLNSIGFIDTKL